MGMGMYFLQVTKERGGGFGDEEYFKQLWSAVSALSNYFIEAAKQEKGMLFWLVQLGISQKQQSS